MDNALDRTSDKLYGFPVTKIHPSNNGKKEEHKMNLNPLSWIKSIKNHFSHNAEAPKAAEPKAPEAPAAEAPKAPEAKAPEAPKPAPGA
jgi:hypothetical protein